MEDWKGYTADGRTDSSPSSLLDGGSSDVMSYAQRSQAADYVFFSQQQQQQRQQAKRHAVEQQQQQGLQQLCMQQQYAHQHVCPQQQPTYSQQEDSGPIERHQALEMADYMEREQQREREVARKQQTALRRGLFSVTELEDWMSEDCPQLDRQVLIRFPPEVAETLRQRLHNAAAAAAAAVAEGEAPDPGAGALGLTITPRPDYNYRAFDVKVSGYRGRLRGILVELPTLIETYKSVDADILFKSGDVCQMLYVYDPQVSNLDLGSLCDKQQWEWRAGLTPPTHRIRSRKFKNIDLFDREEIRDAELEVLQLLHGLKRDTYEIEVHTELEMLEARKKEQEQQQQQPGKPTAASAASSSDPPRVERVVLTTEDVTELLSMVDQEDEYLSDASDILFSLQSDSASQPGAETTARSRRGRGGGAGGLSRFTPAGGIARHGAEASVNAGMMNSSAQLQMQLSQQQHQQQLLLQQQGQLLQGFPEVVAPEAEVDDAEERERSRLRKERRKQRKDRKKARREHKLQHNQAGMGPGPGGESGRQVGHQGALASAALPHWESPAATAGEAAALRGNEDAEYDGISSVGSPECQ